jgi:hypothetical protein
MEDNEEKKFDGNFPSHARFGALMMMLQWKSLKERRQMMIPQTNLGRRCAMRVKIVKVRMRG